MFVSLIIKIVTVLMITVRLAISL